LLAMSKQSMRTCIDSRMHRIRAHALPLAGICKLTDLQVG
jgi:hypothetical protein